MIERHDMQADAAEIIESIGILIRCTIQDVKTQKFSQSREKTAMRHARQVLRMLLDREPTDEEIDKLRGSL